MPFVVFHFSHDELLEFELDPELESESEPEELAGQSSRSCVAVAVSSISAVFFSCRLRFFGAASPAGEPLVRLEAALAACLPLELAGLAVPPAGPELPLAGSAVEAAFRTVNGGGHALASFPGSAVVAAFRTMRG